MKSLRQKEGYLLLDNRHAPPPPDRMISAMRQAGHEPFVPETPVFETATITCSHCQTMLIRSLTRTRPREYCGKCDHYICDGCAFLAAQPDYVHLAFNDFVDRSRNTAVQLLGKD